MPDTPGQQVLNRLASVSAFRPSTTESFTDWRLQAGDVVSVTSGTDTYQVPIFGMTLKWNGKPRASLESTGNQEREELPAMQRKSYATGARGYANSNAILGNTQALSSLDGSFWDFLAGGIRAQQLWSQSIMTGTLSAGTTSLGATTIVQNGYIDLATNNAQIFMNNEKLIYDTRYVRWKTAHVVTDSQSDVSDQRLFKYQDSGGTEHTETGRIVKGFTTITYLGN